MDQLKPDGFIHIIPDNDLIEHYENERCPCRPEWDKKNKQQYLRHEASNKVIIHNRLLDNPQ
jgi:hypothetical protein